MLLCQILAYPVKEKRGSREVGIEWEKEEREENTIQVDKRLWKTNTLMWAIR